MCSIRIHFEMQLKKISKRFLGFLHIHYLTNQRKPSKLWSNITIHWLFSFTLGFSVCGSDIFSDNLRGKNAMGIPTLGPRWNGNGK